jgi:hypothetical protein
MCSICLPTGWHPVHALHPLGPKHCMHTVMYRIAHYVMSAYTQCCIHCMLLLLLLSLLLLLPCAGTSGGDPAGCCGGRGSRRGAHPGPHRSVQGRGQEGHLELARSSSSTADVLLQQHVVRLRPSSCSY